MHHLPGSGREGRSALTFRAACAALGAAALLAAGCAEKAPELYATGVTNVNLDANTKGPVVFAAVDGGGRVGVKNQADTDILYATEHFFPANPGPHTLRLYVGAASAPVFECSFTLPTASVADFEYGMDNGKPPLDRLRCPPLFRAAPPALN